MDLAKKTKTQKISGFAETKMVCVSFFMVDEGVPTGFHRIPARYHAFRGLALRSAQRCGRRCSRDPPATRRAGKPKRKVGFRGWGIFPKKNGWGVPLNDPPEKITYPALGKGKIIDSKMIFEWDMLVSSQED